MHAEENLGELAYYKLLEVATERFIGLDLEGIDLGGRGAGMRTFETGSECACYAPVTHTCYTIIPGSPMDTKSCEALAHALRHFTYLKELILRSKY